MYSQVHSTLDSHLHFDSWVWVISSDLKFIKREAVNIWDIVCNLQGWKWARLPLKLWKQNISFGKISGETNQCVNFLYR